MKRMYLAVLMLSVAACSDGVGPKARESAPVTLLSLHCTAGVSGGEFSNECRPQKQGGGPSRAVILLPATGIEMIFANPTLDTLPGGVQIATIDALIWNTRGATFIVGSPDNGLTATGADAFFHDGPTVTQGSGMASVLDNDGAGTFTASGQPYYHYDGMVIPTGTSLPRTWTFELDSGVEEFEYTIYVQADTST